MTEAEHGDPPFLVKLFHKTGALVRAEELSRDGPLLPHALAYAWPSCTLADLVLELAGAAPEALPEQAIGTRLVFQLLFPSPPPLRQCHKPGHPWLDVSDLGSVVITSGLAVHTYGPDEIDDGELEPVAGDDADTDKDDRRDPAGMKEKTLVDMGFVVGDYIVVAVLPVLEDGTVAPANSAKLDWSHRPPGERGGRKNASFRRNKEVPSGEWRRGEALPKGNSRR